jgi:Berberine and berberine like
MADLSASGVYAYLEYREQRRYPHYWQDRNVSRLEAHVPYVMNIIAEWNADDVDDAEKQTQWVRAFQRALLPFTLKGVYTNFLGEEGEEQVRASYSVNYERLVALKNTYDPSNTFHFNPNIQPTRSANDQRVAEILGGKMKGTDHANHQ